MDTTDTPNDAKHEVWEDEGGRVRPVPASAPVALYDRLMAMLFDRFGRGAAKSPPVDDDAGKPKG